MTKNFLAVVGGFVILLSAMSALGVGNFVMKFDTQPIICVRGV